MTSRANLQTNEKHVDTADWQVLLQKILAQSMDDYVKLQHPNQRRKKYLYEAFHNAVDMFFDSEYRFLHIKNDDGEDMSLEDFVKSMMDSDRVELKRLRQHLVDEAVSYWETKEIRTVYIPDSVVVEGHVYHVAHSEDSEDIEIDFDDKTITINKTVDNSENQERFVSALLQCVLHHTDVKMSARHHQQVSKALFRLLRVNNCFTGS